MAEERALCLIVERKKVLQSQQTMEKPVSPTRCKVRDDIVCIVALTIRVWMVGARGRRSKGHRVKGEMTPHHLFDQWYLRTTKGPHFFNNTGGHFPNNLWDVRGLWVLHGSAHFRQCFCKWCVGSKMDCWSEGQKKSNLDKSSFNSNYSTLLCVYTTISTNYFKVKQSVDCVDCSRFDIVI